MAFFQKHHGGVQRQNKENCVTVQILICLTVYVCLCFWTSLVLCLCPEPFTVRPGAWVCMKWCAHFLLCSPTILPRKGAGSVLKTYSCIFLFPKNTVAALVREERREKSIDWLSHSLEISVDSRWTIICDCFQHSCLHPLCYCLLTETFHSEGAENEFSVNGTQ